MGIIVIIDLDDYWLPTKEHPIHSIIVQNKIDEKIKNNLRVASYVTTTTEIFADEIKKLMIENPIDKPKMVQTSDFLSDEIIEGAQKLMGSSPKQQPQGQSQGQSVPGINMNSLKQMIRDTVSAKLS